MARKRKEQKNFPTAANFFSAEKEYIFLNNMLASGILRNGKKKENSTSKKYVKRVQF